MFLTVFERFFHGSLGIDLDIQVLGKYYSNKQEIWTIWVPHGMENMAARGNREVFNHVLHTDGTLRDFIGFGFENS